MQALGQITPSTDQAEEAVRNRGQCFLIVEDEQKKS
jgi:hypothetical protein